METLMMGKGGGVPNDLACLDGARFVAASEAGQGKRLHESKIKEMTGGDRIAARYLYGEFFEFTPKFKLWLATNELPRIDGTDDGIWRRIMIIPFNVAIPRDEQDGALRDKLTAELPGVLNWALEGCLAWQKGKLQPPEEVLAATREYRSDMDIIAQFIEDACIIDAQATETSKKLYEGYRAWSEGNGYQPVSQVIFGRRLKARGFKEHRTAKARMWTGLRLRGADEILADDFVDGPWCPEAPEEIKGD
jgi:putative DNA primase/helicase